MAVSHYVDNINNLIISDWKGDADVDKFIRSYRKYLESVRNMGEYTSYNEIVNFKEVRKLNLSLNDLKKYAALAASQDGLQTKMAIIVNDGLAFVLATGYIAVRKLTPGNKKKVRVFLNYHDALRWISDE